LVRHGFQVPVTNPYTIRLAELPKREPILWVDARDENLFHEQRIPDAINLNSKNWERELGQLFERFAPGKTVVVYCSAGCQESEHVAARIRELGIEPVLVLEGGFEAWRKKHRP
jgi:rhodanese-related sulfurtransferase